MKKRIIAVLLALVSILGASAQIIDANGQYVDTVFHDHINRQAEDFVLVSLCVADPTDWHDDLLGVLGHAFIRLQCPVFNLDNCFSYECESVEDNGWRYLTGDLKMGMFRYSTASQIEIYNDWNRTIHEYRLNLPPEAEQRLWEIMDNHVNNGVHLPIDMYKRGCAISLVHFVTQALGDTPIQYTQWPTKFDNSRYEIIVNQLAAYPWLRLGLFKLVDKRFDRPCPNQEKLVIPSDLAEVWQHATIDGSQPLAVYIGDLTKGAEVVVEKTYFTPTVALLTVLLLIAGGIGFGIWYKRKPPVLLPYSQLVWEMEKQMPGVYDYRLSFIFPIEQVNKERLQCAIQTAIDNHPVFAQLGRRYYDFQVWEQDNIGHLDIQLNRILGDGQSVMIWIEGIGRAYLGLPLEKDNYTNYIRCYLGHQHTERFIAHKAQMIERYGTVVCPVRPTTDYPLDSSQTWNLGVYTVPISAVFPQELSSNQTICLATAIAIMDYCGTDEAALTWAYVGRETIEDQHIFGSLHKDIPMRISRASTRKEYIRQIRQECRKGIACSDYPLTLTPPYTEIWNYAVNVLEQPDLHQLLADFPIPLEPVMTDNERSMAYSLLDIEIEDTQLVFKYSATHYKPESIARFAEMVVDNVTWLNNENRTDKAAD